MFAMKCKFEMLEQVDWAFKTVKTSPACATVQLEYNMQAWKRSFSMIFKHGCNSLWFSFCALISHRPINQPIVFTIWALRRYFTTCFKKKQLFQTLHNIFIDPKFIINMLILIECFAIFWSLIAWQLNAHLEWVNYKQHMPYGSLLLQPINNE